MAADVTPTPSPGAIPKSGVLRERFNDMKDVALENAMGKGESWAKKVGYGAQGVMLDDIPKLLDILGLKVVDKGKVCVDRAVHEAYRTIAAAHLTSPKIEDDWDK